MSVLEGLPIVFLGGGAGAAARHGVGRMTGNWSAITGWPLGTFAVNLTGSLFLGLLAGLAERGLGPAIQLLLGTGVAGGYTTFSSLSYESVRMAEEGRWRDALLNPAASLVLGFLAFAGGLALTQGAGL